MNQSKLLEIYHCLDKKEMRALGKFVRSPYFNQREDIVRLHDYLARHCSGPSELLEKPTVFKKIFPKTPFSEKQIRYTMSFLFKKVSEFLTVEELQSEPVDSSILFVKAMRKRGAERLFDGAFKTAEQHLERSPFRNLDFHFHQYQLRQEQFLSSIGQSRKATPGLQKMSDELTHFFISNTLRQSCFALSFRAFNTMDFRENMLSQVITFVEENNLVEVPAIGIYYLSFRTLTEEKPLPVFQDLKKYIREKGGYFPKEERKGIFTLALNFCIRQINLNNAPFKKEAFELYQEGLAQEIFIEGGYLSRFTYKNIVAIGLGLVEFDWVRGFIEEYRPFLEKKFRQGAYNFNMALYHFKKEEYGEAMGLLQRVGTDDLLNNLNARRMLLRIYYDLGELDALESLLGSFQTYIYRKKGIGYHRELYLNLVRFTRRLLHLSPHEAEQIDSLESDIMAVKDLPEKAWLLEKLSVLKSGS